jgi:pilus assembly protein CpaB
VSAVPAKAILSLLFLASLSVVVVLGLRALPHSATGTTAAGAEDVLVAATSLPAGSLLRQKDVEWRPVTGVVVPGLISRLSGNGSTPSAELDQQIRAEVYGAALRAGVNAGDPIERGAFVRPGDRDFLRVVLSPRARAIAIPVAAGGASTGILYPGDWVDVILTQTFKNDPPLTRRSVGETVVENMRVLAIDPPEAKPNSATNTFGRTVTLEVTPEQAEKINVAAELGKLSLTLRSISAADGIVDISAGRAKSAGIKPIWAGDVSPALDEVAPAKKAIAAQPQGVEVIRGTKIVTVKSQ